MNFYDLSQRSPDIYKSALLDQKRQLIRLVFDKLILDDGKLKYAYTKPFQLLNDAVTATNSSKILKDKVLRGDIFEPEEKVDITRQSGDFEDHRSILLPMWDIIRTLMPKLTKYNIASL